MPACPYMLFQQHMLFQQLASLHKRFVHYVLSSALDAPARARWEHSFIKWGLFPDSGPKII